MHQTASAPMLLNGPAPRPFSPAIREVQKSTVDSADIFPALHTVLALQNSLSAASAHCLETRRRLAQAIQDLPRITLNDKSEVVYVVHPHEQISAIQLSSDPLTGQLEATCINPGLVVIVSGETTPLFSAEIDAALTAYDEADDYLTHVQVRLKEASQILYHALEEDDRCPGWPCQLIDSAGAIWHLAIDATSSYITVHQMGMAATGIVGTSLHVVS